MKKYLMDFFHSDLGDKFEKASRLLLLIVIIVCCFYVVISTISLFPEIINKTEGSNLGILLKSLQKNWYLSFLLSFLITYLCFIIWMFFVLILKFKINKTIFKKAFLSSLGVFLITFIFIFILASTKPSNNTIVFSALSAIGTSISFCYTLFNNSKE